VLLSMALITTSGSSMRKKGLRRLCEAFMVVAPAENDGKQTVCR
jgi:hypothetical protein